MSTVWSARLSPLTTASLKKPLTRSTSGFFGSAPTITVLDIFSAVLVVRMTLKPRSRNARPTSPANPRLLPPLKSSQVTVKVFNGGSKRGLAGDVGRALRDRGFNVIRTTNTAEKISKTVIVGADPKNPEVLLVKGFFKGAVVKGDKRVDHTVDVLVGNKYGGFNKGAKRTN